MSTTARKRTLKMVQMAFLMALIVVLQVISTYVKVGPVNITLVLIPIVLGGVMLGRGAGTFLGTVFGFVTLIMGLTGTDGGFVLWLMDKHPVITIILCVVKGVAAGAGAAWIYGLLKKKSEFWATVAASAAAPIINTGLFFLGSLLMLDTYSVNDKGVSGMYYLIFFIIGVNFIFEFFSNLILSPVIRRIQNAFRKRV